MPAVVERTLKPQHGLELSEWVLVGGAGAALIYIVVAARWVPRVWESFGAFFLIALGPLVFHRLEVLFPKTRFWVVSRSFWLLPSMILGHWALAPISASVRPTLLDEYLATADLLLFREHPSVWLEHRLSPWATELFLICYYTYYIWPLLVAAVLYTQQSDVYRRYRLAISMFFVLNFLGYVWVPAVGPRFYLAHAFDGPLHGLWLTPYLESAMRGPYFLRDCFPSGHTGLTLLVLAFAFRYSRKVFWLMLLPCVGLIASTVVGRFHYVIDLLGAIPLSLVSFRGAHWGEAVGSMNHSPDVSSKDALY